MGQHEKWRAYEAAKRAWAEDHPNATPQEYETAIRAIAADLGL